MMRARAFCWIVWLATVPIGVGAASAAHVAVSDYGGDFDAMIEANRGSGHTFLVGVASTCSKSLTIQSGNTLEVLAGGYIAINDGCMLHIGCDFVAPKFQKVFSNCTWWSGLGLEVPPDGYVSFWEDSVTEVYPEWWGAQGYDGTADGNDYNALMCACYGAIKYDLGRPPFRQPIVKLQQLYPLKTGLDLRRIQFNIQGWTPAIVDRVDSGGWSDPYRIYQNYGSGFIWTGAADANVFTIQNGYNCRLADFRICVRKPNTENRKANSLLQLYEPEGDLDAIRWATIENLRVGGWGNWESDVYDSGASQAVCGITTYGRNQMNSENQYTNVIVNDCDYGYRAYSQQNCLNVFHNCQFNSCRKAGLQLNSSAILNHCGFNSNAIDINCVNAIGGAGVAGNGSVSAYNCWSEQSASFIRVASWAPSYFKGGSWQISNQIKNSPLGADVMVDVTASMGTSDLRSLSFEDFRFAPLDGLTETPKFVARNTSTSPSPVFVNFARVWGAPASASNWTLTQAGTNPGDIIKVNFTDCPVGYPIHVVNGNLLMVGGMSDPEYRRLDPNGTSFYRITVRDDKTGGPVADFNSVSIDFFRPITRFHAATDINTTGDFLTRGARVNYHLTAYASGTPYSLTTAPALLDFGSADPLLILIKAGTYSLRARVNLKYDAATFTANRIVTLKLRRTNNTAADITNSSTSVTTEITAAKTGAFQVVELPEVIYRTSRTDDVIEVWGSIDAAPSAGTLRAVEASLIAVRLY